jgi:hypothetical protein
VEPTADRLEQLIDLSRYPLDQPESSTYRMAVERGREQLTSSGAAELEGFLSPEGVAALVADAEELATRAHRSSGIGTAYLEIPDASFAQDHPRQTWGDYSLGAVALDLMPRTSPLRRLYEWSSVTAFIAAILNRGPVFPYADPFGALNLAVMEDGDQLQWHFDQTDFVVSLAIQSAATGGDFEVAPRIRSGTAEHYEEVGSVLAGDRSKVIALPMTPGTLLVFEGRNSLHRVAPIVGEIPRHVALLAYDTKPGTMGSELLRHVRYGRSEPFPEPPETWPESSDKPVSVETAAP